MRFAHPDEAKQFLTIDDAGVADVRVLLRDLLVAQDGRCDLRHDFVSGVTGDQHPLFTVTNQSSDQEPPSILARDENLRPEALARRSLRMKSLDSLRSYRPSLTRDEILRRRLAAPQDDDRCAGAAIVTSRAGCP
jgi:hypothetical protein